MAKIRVVLDTNVVFEGLTFKNGICNRIIEAWDNELIDVAVSDAIVFEYFEVLSRKLSAERWSKTQDALEYLLVKAQFIGIYYKWRPSSPDPDDEAIIDCAMNRRAIIVTYNRRDFLLAEQTLGLQVMTPLEFITFLINQEE